jgi:acyl dehydratase
MKEADGWEGLAIGTEAGRVEIAVTDAMIDDYLETMELDCPFFLRPIPPFAARIAPPDMVPKLAMAVLSEAFCNRVVGPNIRAKQVFQFFVPVFAGTLVRATSRVVEKYERRNRRFVTLEALFVDGAGQRLALDRRTQMVLGSDFAMKC